MEMVARNMQATSGFSVGGIDKMQERMEEDTE